MAMGLFMFDFFQLRKMEKEEEKAELAAAENDTLKIRSNSVYSLDKRECNFQNIIIHVQQLISLHLKFKSNDLNVFSHFE